MGISIFWNRHTCANVPEIKRSWLSVGRLGVVAILLLVSAQAAERRISMDDSVAPIPSKIAATRSVLKSNHLAQKIKFTVAMKLRNYEGMQARIARGGKIPRAELERLYLPLKTDYDAMVAWLTSQGLTVTRQDPNRMNIFVQGSVSQIQTALQVKMSNMTSENKTFPVAENAPTLPETLSSTVLGVNGLQSFRQRRKHAILRPLTSNAAPFLVSEILKAYNGQSLGVSGNGQRIAILIDTFPKDTDMTAFWTNNGISQSLSNLEKIDVNNGGTSLPAVSGEETLDAQWTSGIAPGAKIRIYASNTLNDADLDLCFQQMITDLGNTSTAFKQLSISLGLGETYSTTAQLNTDAALLSTIASNGVSIFVSSGDNGSTPSDTGTSTGPLQVEYYSSDVSVTAVGGTSLTVNSGTGARTSETAWSGSGGGVSAQFTRPSWQKGTGVPTGTKRCVPDVSMVADPNTGAYVYLSGAVQQYGGTSLSAPIWAGISALLNEKRANSGRAALGLLNPYLYPLIGTSSFTDITSGSNNLNTTNSGGKYSATTGYDQVTGVGAPNITNLLAALNPSAPTITSFTPTTGAAGSSVVITGTNLTGASVVSFNGTAATTYTINSDTQITVTVPSGITAGTISVTTAGGTATSSASFTPTSNPVLISQVYGGGGNASAPYLNDYVELYNNSSSSVSLAGWSIQYASATGATWTAVSLTGSISANSYYLIKLASGGAIGSALPTASVTSSGLNISATAGKVALLSNTTALTVSTYPTGNANLVDYVGYGTNASAYEGSAAAPAGSSTLAIFRAGSGVTDTNNNSTDFSTGTPNPRSQLAGSPTSTPTPTPSPTPTPTPAAGSPTITSFTPISGNVGGTVVLTGNNFTGTTSVIFNGVAATSFTVDSNTQITASVPATTTGPISITNAVGTGTSAGSFTVGSFVLISQIYGGGGNTYLNDYVELYNAGSTTVDVSTWSIQYSSSSGTTWNTKTNLTGSIAPGNYYLIQLSAGSAGTALPTPNVTGTTNLSATSGKVALFKNQTTFSGSSPVGNADLIDFVGYGSANAFKGTGAAPTLSNTTAALRAGNGATDTGNNASDFTAGTPNPRNSAASTVTPTPTTAPTATPTPTVTLIPTATPTPTPTPTITPTPTPTPTATPTPTTVVQPTATPTPTPTPVSGAAPGGDIPVMPPWTLVAMAMMMFLSMTWYMTRSEDT
jgi:kumamolisin